MAEHEHSKEVDPRMHSAEHILTATMMKMFSCGRPFTTHIEKKKSKADYRFDRELTADEVAQVQTKVNEIIKSDLPVTETFLSRSEAERRHDLERLPSESGDTVRLICIGDYDACPCIGPHVKKTCEIGAFRIVSVSHESGALRVRFKLEQPALTSSHG